MIFLYGTLRYAPLLALVLGGAKPRSLPARLQGHAVRWAEGESFPLLVTAPDDEAEGLLLETRDGKGLHRLDYYEAAFGYERQPVSVMTTQGPRQAQVYVPPAGTWRPGEPWSLESWALAWGALTLRAADEVMDFYHREPAREVARHFNETRVRAASWVRAQTDSTAMRVRRGPGAEAVRLHARARPYRGFFMMEEHDLQFPLFGGGISDTVSRACFVSGDAVTVLPYDPARDRVLLVEQFRFGPYVRGDRHPWSIEAIAGRIDPGEAPEAAARREAREEGHVSVAALEFVARYYPTPSAMSEYIFSFVGLADLPDDVARIGGVEDEHEDIRGILLDFDAAMDLLATGEAENAPLILSLQWLARHRDRLRARA